MNDLCRIDPDPGFAAILHHNMKIRRRMVSGVDAHQTSCKALNNRHGIYHSATVARLATGLSGCIHRPITRDRFVGVAPTEVDEDFDFEKKQREIHIELADLNRESVELALKIQTNFEGLGV